MELELTSAVGPSLQLKRHYRDWYCQPACMLAQNAMFSQCCQSGCLCLLMMPAYDINGEASAHGS